MLSQSRAGPPSAAGPQTTPTPSGVVSVKQNLFSGIPSKLRNERVDDLVASAGLRIERIISTGHASPPGFWYDQPWSEWVVVLSGSAGLLIEGEARRWGLRVGGYLMVTKPAAPGRVDRRARAYGLACRPLRSRSPPTTLAEYGELSGPA